MLFSILSTLTDAITTAIGNYGLYAVFLLMLIDAVLPAASEVVMVYGGAIASGAIAGTSVNLFGYTFEPGLPAYLAIAIAGTIGYLIGSILGWEIGRRGGRPYLEKHGRWLHLDHEKLERAEAWFLRWEDWAVFVGRITPVVRSFVSVPAGIFEAPFKRYTVLTLIGSALWCFVFAGIGWAAGANWESFHHAFRYADIAVGLLIVGGVGWLGWRYRRKRQIARSAEPS
jgi:membrane protein DedA with SNARE-associated domain